MLSELDANVIDNNEPGSSSTQHNQQQQLPVLQIWPSCDDNPIGDRHQDHIELSELTVATSNCSLLALHDSGIESSQVSPLINNQNKHRKSSVFLHPNRANDTQVRRALSSETVFNDDNYTRLSYTDIVDSTSTSPQNTLNFDNILREATFERQRRSSSIAQYYLNDNSELEFAILKAASRGSCGHHSLSDCSQKLTFTQSLAFPELAKNFRQKRFYRKYSHSSQPRDRCLNNRRNHQFNYALNIAKLVTSFVLVLTSFMVFIVVYHFVRT